MKKGISLVALVITIIVLIILTGAIVLTALDVNLFGRAESARDESNKQEVYLAVQREVLDIQSSRVGLAVSAEFATELQTRLLNKHSGSNATATYSTGTDSIAITFDLGKKTYNLTLDNKYRLTMDEQLSDSELQIRFVEDLGTAMEKYFDTESSAYDLASIQREMDQKYPEAEYIYLMEMTLDDLDNPGQKKTVYLPFLLGTNLTTGETDTGSLPSTYFTTKINYKDTVKAIEDGELKDNVSYEILDYLTYEEASKLYTIEDTDTITKYKGAESKVTIPRVILAESGEDYYMHIDTIGESAFEKVVVTKIDLVTDLLGTTYDAYNAMTVTELVLAAEQITDVTQSQVYTEGMTKDEYVEKIIAAQGAEVYKEDGHLYTYMTESGKFTTKPSDVEITEIIIPHSGTKINISTYAFKNNASLKTIRFNCTIKTIERYGLAYCDGLTDIYMPLYTMEEVQAMTNYSDNKWGAPNATIHCSDGDL